MKKEGIKKAIVRIIGAAFIIGAVLMLFFSAWVQIDGLNRKELRALVRDTSEILEVGQEYFVDSLENDWIKEDLQDNDLPHQKSSVRSWFRTLDSMLTELLDTDFSMHELFTLAWHVPTYIQSLDNFLGTELMESSLVGNAASRYMDDVVDELQIAIPVCRMVVVFFALLAILALWAVIGHLCNKGRWGKYILLFIVLVMVIGSFLAVPMASEILQDYIGDLEDVLESMRMSTTLDLDDIELRMSVMPAIATVLLLVPVALDLIFERKKAAV